MHRACGMSCSKKLATIKVLRRNPSFLSAARSCFRRHRKVVNSTEDAHRKSMSIFETDEHLQGLRPAITGVRYGITLDWVSYSTVADEHI